MSYQVVVYDKKEDWLTARANGLGGTAISGILGLDKYNSPFKVYWEKTTDVKNLKANIPMRRGTILEPLIVELFKEQNPDIRVSYEPDKWILYIDTEHPWRRGTPDAELLSLSGQKGILECKSTSGNNQHIWFHGVPTKYKIQTTYYMNILEVDIGFIAYLIDDVFLYSPIEATADYRAMINNTADIFWNEHVIPRIPPEATTLEDLKHTFLDTLKGSILEVEPEFIESLDKFNNKRELIAGLENNLKVQRAELDELERYIRLGFGNHEFATFNDEVVARLQAWGKGRRLTVHNHDKLEDIINDD
jgi:putative phage-type endonuclease